MSEIVKRNVVLFPVLFALQFLAFHLAYDFFPGDGVRIHIFLIVWFLVWVTWFAAAYRQAKRKWLYFTLILILSVAGQFLSWISFLYFLFHG
ncbi:hypothetical protein [Paenibacillus thermotolerans]|uniref:hypothetical protein n=1 Tax=Paenibacillus thermotolerans TaxID=3027807 RepID=UPI00236888B4|nr:MULTISPECIES: hypothetical protein [unclassified Paenibacillus]